MSGESSITRLIKVLEDLFELDDVTDVHEMLDEEAKSCLLCLIFTVE